MHPLIQFLQQLFGANQSPQQPPQPQPQMQQQPNLQVTNSHAMQPSQMGAEDEYMPADALFQTGYTNPQTTLHGNFIQSNHADGRYPNFINHPNYDPLQVMLQVFRNLK